MIIFNGDEEEFYEYLMKPKTFFPLRTLQNEYLSANDNDPFTEFPQILPPPSSVCQM